jgi:hypothetical protein
LKVGRKMAKHSSIGASSCHRWWNCPGSVALCADIKSPPPGPHAQEGTAAHELAEQSIIQQVRPHTLVGQKAANGIRWTTEMADNVEFYLTTITNDAIDNGVEMDEVHFETRFHLSDIDEGAFGTCDAYFAVPFGKLFVYDLKYGVGTIVDVENNLQMQYYALGALANTLDVTDVEMVIVQPRTEDRAKRWCVPVEQMDAFKDDLRRHIDETRVEGAELADGKHCKYCPALAVCPQVSKKVVEVAQQDFMGITPNTPAVEAQKPLPAPGELTLPQLKLVLDKADLIGDWLTAVEAYAKSLIEAGSTIEGYKLVPKRAHRKWADEFEVETTLADFGDAVYEKKLKTPKQMEAVVGKEKVAELSITPDNGFTLAKDEDKRTEAKSDFTAIATDKPKRVRRTNAQIAADNAKNEF